MTIHKLAITFGLGGGWLDPKGGEVYYLCEPKPPDLLCLPFLSITRTAKASTTS